MSQVNFMRHSGLFGPEDASDKVLTIIGVGATGSWVALLAAKMGWHNFVLWDPDTVESHNLPNQAYDIEHLGMNKVDAMKDVILRFNPQCQITTHSEIFDYSDKNNFTDYVYVAVDSLLARRQIISEIKYLPFTSAVFETKMGFTHAELNMIDPSDEKTIDNYLSILKNDDEVTESACNEKIITTLTTIVASSLVHLLAVHSSADRKNINSSDLFSKQIFHLPNHLTSLKV